MANNKPNSSTFPLRHAASVTPGNAADGSVAKELLHEAIEENHHNPTIPLQMQRQTLSLPRRLSRFTAIAPMVRAKCSRI